MRELEGRQLTLPGLRKRKKKGKVNTAQGPVGSHPTDQHTHYGSSGGKREKVAEKYLKTQWLKTSQI